MKSLKECETYFSKLMNDIEKNLNSHEARIKLPEALAGFQYHYTKASYRLAGFSIFISLIAIIIALNK